MQSDVNFPLVLCKPTSQIIQPKFNQCKRFVLHPHFLFIYLTISILGSSIIFGLSLKYTLRFVPSNFDFPYEGNSYLTITVRWMKKYGYDVLLEITKGQMVGNEYNGTNYVRVRFDGGKVQKFYYNEPNDGSSNLVFLKKAHTFIEKCKSAKDIIIEQEFYQEGVHQFKFHVDEPLPKKLK